MIGFFGDEPPSEDQIVAKIAKAAVKRLLKNLTDRRGLWQEWESIDDATQAEIVAEWESCIKAAIKKYVGGR